MFSAMNFLHIAVMLMALSFVSSKPQSLGFIQIGLSGGPNDSIENVPPLSPASLAADATSSWTKSQIGGRIVGGVETAPNEFPWQGFLQMEMVSGNYYSCGGSVIGDQWILTAAHCLQISGEQLKSVLVVLGMHNRSSSSEVNRRIYQANRAFIHSNFDSNTLDGDVALIQLPIIQYTNYIQPISIASSSEPNHVNDPVVITGWGRTSDSSSNGSPVLRKATVSVISNNDCQSYYVAGLIKPGMMCTNSLNQPGTCNGDSGGPLHFWASNGGWRQVGITSFVSSRGCQSGGPNGFTRISYYSSWIQNIIATWTQIQTPTPTTTTTPTSTPASTPSTTTTTTTTQTSTPTSTPPTTPPTTPITTEATWQPETVPPETAPTTKPNSALSCAGKPNGNYPISTCSDTFYICSNEIGYIYTCPSGLIYRSETKECDWSYKVAGCQ